MTQGEKWVKILDELYPRDREADKFCPFKVVFRSQWGGHVGFNLITACKKQGEQNNWFKPEGLDYFLLYMIDLYLEMLVTKNQCLSFRGMGYGARKAASVILYNKAVNLGYSSINKKYSKEYLCMKDTVTEKTIKQVCKKLNVNYDQELFDDYDAKYDYRSQIKTSDTGSRKITIDKSKVKYDIETIKSTCIEFCREKMEKAYCVVWDPEKKIYAHHNITSISRKKSVTPDYYALLGFCIEHNAKYVIDIHNHPTTRNNDIMCYASEPDVLSALDWREKLQKHGITLLDSLIVTEDLNLWSIAEHDWKYETGHAYKFSEWDKKFFYYWDVDTQTVEKGYY